MTPKFSIGGFGMNDIFAAGNVTGGEPWLFTPENAVVLPMRLTAMHFAGRITGVGGRVGCRPEQSECGCAVDDSEKAQKQQDPHEANAGGMSTRSPRHRQCHQRDGHMHDAIGDVERDICVETRLEVTPGCFVYSFKTFLYICMFVYI